MATGSLAAAAREEAAVEEESTGVRRAKWLASACTAPLNDRLQCRRARATDRRPGREAGLARRSLRCVWAVLFHKVLQRPDGRRESSMPDDPKLFLHIHVRFRYPSSYEDLTKE